MVEITARDNVIHVEMLGWSKLFTLRGSLDIPARCVRSAVAGEPGLPVFRWNDLRLGATGVPGLIAAGACYMGRPRRWVFLDLRRSSKNVLVLELEGYSYSTLMVEVADVPQALRLVEATRETAGAHPAR